MKVDEKCDVYSFGVVTLEVMMGKHPGDFMSSLMLSASTSSSSAIGHNTVLKDVLDQRLPPPQNFLLGYTKPNTNTQYHNVYFEE